MARFSLPMLCLLLAGCATTTAPTVDIKTICLPLKAYTPQQDADMAAQLPSAGPAIQAAIADYKAMRDADRACAAPAK